MKQCKLELELVIGGNFIGTNNKSRFPKMGMQ